MIVEINNFKKVKLKENFIWASHNQVIELINRNKMTIEARNYLPVVILIKFTKTVVYFYD